MTRLNHDLLDDFDVIDFGIGPDGRTVAYTTMWSGMESELWITDVDGSSHQRLAQGNMAATTIREAPAFRFSSDGSTLVFATTPSPGASGGITGLASRLADGSGSTLVLVEPFPLNSPQEIIEYQISPDGRTVIYRVRNGSDYALYRVRAGSPPEVINRPLVAGGTVQQFVVSWIAGRIVYVADDITDERFEIYSLPLLAACRRDLSART